MLINDERIQFFNTTDYPAYREDVYYLMIVDGKFEFVDPIDKAKRSKHDCYPLFWRWKLFVDKHVTKSEYHKYIIYITFNKNKELYKDMLGFYDNNVIIEDMMSFTANNKSILARDKIDIMQDIVNAYNEKYYKRGH